MQDRPPSLNPTAPCVDVLRLLDDHAAGETAPESVAAFHAHLETCPDCRAAFAGAQAFRSRLRRVGRVEQAPNSLRDRAFAVHRAARGDSR